MTESLVQTDFNTNFSILSKKFDREFGLEWFLE